MRSAVRWLLVLPVAFTAAAVTLFVLGLINRLTSSLNIIPQNDFISIGLFTLGANGIAALAAVNSGHATAPRRSKPVGYVLAAIMALVGVFDLARAFVDPAIPRTGLDRLGRWVRIRGLRDPSQ